MTERISLGGAPVVGFGLYESEPEMADAKRLAIPTLIGFVTGSAGGALLGHKVGSGAAVALGSVAGGVGGFIVGGVVAVHLLNKAAAERKAASTPTATVPAAQRMKPGDVWSATANVNLLKPVGSDLAAKQSLEKSILEALAQAGFKGLDADWDGRSPGPFAAVLAPTREMAPPAQLQLPLNSEWADKITFTNFAWAPIKPTA